MNSWTGCCPGVRKGRLPRSSWTAYRIGDDDELGTFIFRTTGYNSIRTLAARLRYYQAVSGNRLAFMPLELRLRGKSTTQSHRTPIYYVDLTVREGQSVQGAIQEAQDNEQTSKQAGYDQAALDETARRGFENAEFENHEDETPAVMEEFYPRTNSNVRYRAVSGCSAGRLTRYSQGITEHLATK